MLINIMAAVRLIGSLYIYSEAGGSAGPGGGQKAVGGRLAAPREGSLRKLERAERGRGGAGQGLAVSLNPSASVPPSAEISYTRPKK